MHAYTSAHTLQGSLYYDDPTYKQRACHLNYYKNTVNSYTTLVENLVANTTAFENARYYVDDYDWDVHGQNMLKCSCNVRVCGCVCMRVGMRNGTVCVRHCISLLWKFSRITSVCAHSAGAAACAVTAHAATSTFVINMYQATQQSPGRMSAGSKTYVCLHDNEWSHDKHCTTHLQSQYVHSIYTVLWRSSIRARCWCRR